MSAAPVAHLNFAGEARDALTFYAAAFGGRSVIRTYGDVGMPAEAPGADRVVFGQVVAENGFTVMAYDVPGSGTLAPAGATRRQQGATLTDQRFFLALQGADLAEAARYWDALADGALVVEALAASAWSPGFGMLTDRFGVTWVISVRDEA